MRPKQEQAIEAFCHLSNAIPIWGLFFCGVVWFWLREESRSVIRQAREALIFHSLILCALLLWCLVSALMRPIRLLVPSLFSIMTWVNNTAMLCVYIAFAAICIWGAVRRLQGEPFHYPLTRGRP